MNTGGVQVDGVPGRAFRLGRKVVLAICCAVIGALFLGWWWSEGGGRYIGAGPSTGSPISVEETTYFGVYPTTDGAITLRSVDVSTPTGSPSDDVDIEVLLLRRQADGVGVGIQTWLDGFERLPVAGTVLDQSASGGPDYQYWFAVAVTPRAPGAWAIDGLELRYQSGSHRPRSSIHSMKLCFLATDVDREGVDWFGEAPEGIDPGHWGIYGDCADRRDR